MNVYQKFSLTRLVLICAASSFGFIATSCTVGEDEGTPNPDANDGTSMMPGGGTGGSSGGGTGGSSGGGPVNSEYCAAAADWPAEYAALEQEVLAIVNERRSQGGNCGSEGQFGPAAPLAMDAALQCAARVHTKDMNERDYFSHQSPDGQQPWDRMELAGYGSYRQAGENIAFGSSTAQGVMDQWMESDGHCANILSDNYEHIGIGYYDGNLWTQVFGSK